MTFDLLFGKDGKNYHVVKIDMATGAQTDFTQEDAEQLLSEQARKEWFEDNQEKVNELAARLGRRDSR